MMKKIGLGALVLLVVFSAYVATRDGKFTYERSGVINAPAAKIFPYLTHLRLGGEWSPFEKVDPNMKKTYHGTDGAVGSIMEFEGNSEAGTGTLEVVKIVPNELSEIRLFMTKPMTADHLVQYRLTPEGRGTRFTWTMSGDGGFMSKLVNLFIDCEKMVGDQFNEGIANLKAIVEAKK